MQQTNVSKSLYDEIKENYEKCLAMILELKMEKEEVKPPQYSNEKGKDN